MNFFAVPRFVRLMSGRLFCLICLLFGASDGLSAARGQTVRSVRFDGAAKPNLSKPLTRCLREQPTKAVVSFASDNQENLFLAFRDGKIEKYNLKNNSVLWASTLAGEITSRIIYNDNKIYLISKVVSQNNLSDSSTSGDSFDLPNQKFEYFLWSLDADTGITLGRFVSQTNSFDFFEIYRDKIFLIDKTGIVFSINKFNAQKTTDKAFETNVKRKIISAPVFFGNQIYISSPENSILNISAADGKIISETATPRPPSAIAVASEKLIWGDKTGNVEVFDTAHKRRLWKRHYGGEIFSLDIAGDNLLISSFDNFVYCVSLRNGRGIWKKRLAGRVSVNPLVVGDYAVFNTVADTDAVIFDLKNGSAVNRISLPPTNFVSAMPFTSGSLLIFPSVNNYNVYSDGDCR